MSPELIIGIIGAIIVAITLLVLVIRKMPKRIKSTHYTQKWREIQKMCANKDDWTHAIIHADMLLDEIMIKKKTVGKTMGERMVAEQKSFTSNDAIWGAHKLANALRQDVTIKVTKPKIKVALVAYRQALRDMGAL